MSASAAITITQIVEATLNVVDELLKKLPDYEQIKKEKYYRLKKNYRSLLTRDHPYRDDNAIDNARDELMEYVLVFSKEIKWNEKQ